MSSHPFLKAVIVGVWHHHSQTTKGIVHCNQKADIISSLCLLIAFWCPNSVAPPPHYIFKRVELLLGKAMLHNRAPPPTSPLPFPLHMFQSVTAMSSTLKRGTEDPLNDQSWRREDKRAGARVAMRDVLTVHHSSSLCRPPPSPPSSQPSPVHGQWDCSTKIVPCLSHASCLSTGLAVFLAPYQKGIPNLTRSAQLSGQLHQGEVKKGRVMTEETSHMAV